MQTCVVHLIRNTFRLTSKRDWDAMKRDVKRDLHGGERAAAARLDELREVGEAVRGGDPAVGERWEQFIPFWTTTGDRR